MSGLNNIKCQMKRLELEFEEILKYVDLHQLKNTKWLITGVSGMIGSYLTNFLLYINKKQLLNMDFTLLYRSPSFQIGSPYVMSNVKWVQVDLAKKFNIEDLESYDYVIHAASNAAPKSYMKDPIGTINTNVKATQYLLERLKTSAQLKSFIFISSGEVYGDAQTSPTKESYIPTTDHLNNRASYVESKRFAEVLCNTYADAFEMPIKIVRPIHIFGPGFKEGDSRVWADFIFNSFQNKSIRILSDGKATRGFCYIPIAINQLMAIIQKGENKGIYNIGNDQAYSILEFAQIIGEVVNNIYNLNVEICVENNAPEHLKNSPSKSCPDIQKVKALGSLVEYSMEEAVKRTVEWYVETNKVRV